MNLDRRSLLHTASLAAGAWLAGACTAGARSRSGEDGPPPKLKLLILGGTGFIGPALVGEARAHGHTVTLFNRGRTNKELFPELEKIAGDRDPKKGDGLKGLEGRTFDVVFDDCGYYPRHVAASSELFAENGVKHLIYVSSISAYAKTDVEGADETAELARLSDPTVEKMGARYENYGGLKVLCEEAAERALPGKTTVVRPGYIVGPGDPTDRFTYWPARFDRGGEVLVPGAPTDPLQVIDVRDLAAFMLRCAERKVVGTFNACGPEKRLPWGEVIGACAKASSAAHVEARWMPLEKLAAHPGVQFPIWAPYDGESKGFHTVSNARGVAAGLAFRPIRATVEDTLAWWRTLPEERRAKIGQFLDQNKEAELIATLG